MKHLKLLSIILLLPSYNLYAQTFTSETDKISYSLGVKTGENYKTQAIELNTESFYQGMLAGLKNQPPALSEQEMNTLLNKVHEQQMTKSKLLLENSAKENLAKGQDFLAKNKQDKDVTVLPSGLQYKVLTKGKGGHPKLSDTVTVNYRGTLIDGTEFDSSYKHKEPATFPINHLIKGWQEALVLMPPGDKWKLFVPPELAYGNRAASAIIQPNSTLIFEIELIAIANAVPAGKAK